MSPRWILFLPLGLAAASTACAAPAFSEFVDPHPSPSNGFGTHIVPLSTGNVVITSPYADLDGSNTGAAYLFNGATGALISTLSGSTPESRVGLDGVVALTNGNYVVASGKWKKGSLVVGAVTWASGLAGIAGKVSDTNSLVGSEDEDMSSVRLVTALTNGNYVVCCPYWNGGLWDRGAVIWCDGSSNGPRSVGQISVTNSLAGAANYIYAGAHGVTALTNGNYVVGTSNQGLGAVTWCEGGSGRTGVVSVGNSLVGSVFGDSVGTEGVVALTNGNYVVRSPAWNGAAAKVGAVTWCDGLTGRVGFVNAENSLVGSFLDDQVGSSGVTALVNGNYVVRSSSWGTSDVGAVTWGDGSQGTVGVVSDENSLAGSAGSERLGSRTVTPLANGHFVVRSPGWDGEDANGSTIRDAGAVTWCNGGSAGPRTVGRVGKVNSLVGTKLEDLVGYDSVTALSNGHYVVCSPYWEYRSASFTNSISGAVTWGNGNAEGPRTTGPVTPENSLINPNPYGYQLGDDGVTALTNGNYVVPGRNGTATGVTWCDGATGRAGLVGADNGFRGYGYAAMALNNGHYLVRSGSAVYWVDGFTGQSTSGIGGVSLSLGSLNTVVTTLDNGNYVVTTQDWSGTVPNAGAVTWIDSSAATVRTPNAANSRVGLTAQAGVKAPILDAVNDTFIVCWSNEGSVRVGSQSDGFDPVISILGNGTAITSGDSTPSVADHTDFGTVAMQSPRVTRTFTVENKGAGVLRLTGTPRVALSGMHAGDFEVKAQPALQLGLESRTTFVITFSPSLPGLRKATVSVSCNDAQRSLHTFDISGVTTPQSQVISFAPPTAAYLGQTSLALTATASSALPVSLSVVSGPANLSGHVLNLTGPGTVKVQATQAGGGYYKAAPPVVASIVVKLDPASLTLIHLNQTYDGQPKPVATLGAEGPVAVTYKVNGLEVPSPPAVAGSYSVKATAGKTSKAATLVIAKAPLYVMPEDKRKLAGQVNPALTSQITGYAPGETAATLLKAPVLSTPATTTSAGGLYPIKSSGGTAANYVFIHRQGTLVVESFTGSYEALVADAASLPVGKVSVTVPTANASFSARLWIATERAALSFAGKLVADELNERASGSATVTQKGVPYTLSFTLTLKGDLLAAVLRNTNELGSANNGRKLGTQAVTHAGAYTAVIKPATPAGANVPAGAGWSTATLGTTGVFTLTGKLGDGTSFTASLASDGESDPGYRLFIQPYLPARTQSYLAGTFILLPHPLQAGRRYLQQAVLTWRKAGLSGDPSYRSDFGPVAATLLIDPWQKPVGTNLSLLLGYDYPEGMIFDVLHSPTASGSHHQLPTMVLLGKTNALSAYTLTSNLTKWKASMVTATGAFSGSFELNEGNGKRTAAFSGVFRQPPMRSDKLIGEGLYILPALTGSEKVAGEISFQRR